MLYSVCREVHCLFTEKSIASDPERNSIMGDVVNLNQFRKSRKKEARKKSARENILTHGQTGLEKKLQKNRRAQEDTLFEQKKLDDDAPDKTDS